MVLISLFLLINILLSFKYLADPTKKSMSSWFVYGGSNNKSFQWFLHLFYDHVQFQAKDNSTGGPSTSTNVVDDSEDVLLDEDDDDELDLDELNELEASLSRTSIQIREPGIEASWEIGDIVHCCRVCVWYLVKEKKKLKNIMDWSFMFSYLELEWLLVVI